MTAGQGQATWQADFVFEGGGVKGIGLAGAYRELTDRGYRPGCVAGTSAGAVTAALVAVGYSGAELEDVVLNQMRFNDFKDRMFLDDFGSAGRMTHFFKMRGMHSGSHLLEWMRARLAAKGITKFGQLYDSTEREARRYRLQVVASDLSGRRMLVLPRDARYLGLDPDELEIAEAVRMSMSIPIFFEPVTVRNRSTGDEHVIVDGGMLSNFPIWLFDCPDGRTPRFPTFGMLLVPPERFTLGHGATPAQEIAAIESDVDLLKAIAETVMEAHDRFYLDQANWARTIAIPTLGVKTTQFGITPSDARALFESGRSSAKEFLDGWDFRSYIEQFRPSGDSGEPAEVKLEA